jgi:hypothetical protein
MKWLEFIGVLLAAVGFGMLSTGLLKIGFLLGFLSCCLLIPFFFLNKMNFLLTLQSYFAIMNVLGIYNNF